MGHSIDPEKELSKLAENITTMEERCRGLLAEARKCQYVSSIRRVEEGANAGKVEMVVETLPEDSRLGQKDDAGRFVYRSESRLFDVPEPPAGLSITEISSSEDAGGLSLTVKYDDGTSDSFAFAVEGNRGPDCTETPRDGKDAVYEDEDTSDSFTHYDKSGNFVTATGSTAGTKISHTGFEASATGLDVGATGASVSLKVSSLSVDGAYVLCQALGWSATGYTSVCTGASQKVLALLQGLGPIGVIVGAIAAHVGAMETPAHATKTSTSFRVNN